ncbi:MAG: SpoIVB peptidase precursor [Firmicutes bacterium ADurb.Bin182]|nr:MAG: SpoIVB peptidase precursor [Firmicutes bacterium ADurb.Bin182]
MIKHFNLKKTAGVILALSVMLFNYSPAMTSLREIPNDIYIKEGQSYSIPEIKAPFSFYPDDIKSVEYSRDQSLADLGLKDPNDSLTIRLFGVVPVKDVTVHRRSDLTVIPGGHSIGVAIFTKGVLVIATGEINTTNGNMPSPAAMAGIKAGDIIVSLNGVEPDNAAHLSKLCSDAKGDVVLGVQRGSDVEYIKVQAELDKSEGIYVMGMWVRDSTTGIGTLSFYDETLGKFASLGHAIADIDTKSKITIKEGKIYFSKVVDIVEGSKGEPGELRGSFLQSNQPAGEIESNSEFGVFGRLYDRLVSQIYPDGLPMAYPEDVYEGPAQLFTTVDEKGVQAFDCEIIKVNRQSSRESKSMVLSITDPELLGLTGGIVQGMSGSPVIQNGKLVGVITHVFVNDPTRGYCIYAYWMNEEMRNAA